MKKSIKLDYFHLAHGRNLSFFLFFLFMLPVAHAQNEVPVHPVDGEYITEWLVLGPFSPDDLAKNFLVDAGGEANIEPEEGDTVVTAQGDTLTWKRHQTNRSIVDLLNVVGNYQNAIAYAFCTLKSDVEGKNQILLGSDDGVGVWINGKRAHYNPAARPLFLDHDIFEVDLKEGTNRCLVKVSQGTGNWGFAMRAFPHNQPVLVTPKFFLSSDDLKDQIWLVNNQWKYHPGDNKEWAKLDFDDSSWEFVNPELRPNELPKSGWQGVGWFRLHIVVDSTLINKPLGLSIWQAGASQLYLDGTLIYAFGEHSDGWTGVPKVLTFDGKKRHVIAVRYSNASIEKFHTAGYNSGFSLRLGYANQMAEETVGRERTFMGFQMFFTTLSLAIGILHLIFFAFFPGLRQNLFFALFLFSYAATIFFDYQILLSTNIGRHLFFFRMHCAVLPLWVLFQLWFVYSLFNIKLPIQFWIISLTAFCLGALAIYKPEQNFEYFGMVYMATYIEITRVIVVSFYKRIEGTWIIAMAFLVFFIFGLLDTLMDKGILVSLREIENPYAFGSIGFFIAMSVYLSRDFARTNKKIVEQEMEQKLLEAENARQSKELEEARQLQLSMLPKELPQLPHLEIGVFMKTAREVGGDYYDFHLADNGTLTIAIGDATGHGMKAGTMVSVIKSLFIAEASQTDILSFFKKCTQTIKQMRLGNLYMAMMLLRIKDHKMTASSAGIPPIYIYRSETKFFEEIVIKGMPLGGPASFPYKMRETKLAPGDTVLLMSDGFPELFNDKDEMLDYPRVKEIFKEAAGRSADEIVAHLFNAGEKWRNGRPQHDDITFVVLKVKQNGKL
jgi:serine phosphatase RsbU (regulator of sigma subunit)